MFDSELEIERMSWQAFERNISRLLLNEGFVGARVVGQTGDHGADVVASKYGKRFVFQAKHWKKPVGDAVVLQTLSAAKEFKAEVPVIVSSSGFDAEVKRHQSRLLSENIPLQLWSASDLVCRAASLPDKAFNKHDPRGYQEKAIREVLGAYYSPSCNRVLVVMATGLGKTFVAAESIRRIRALKPDTRVLICAHTKELVSQLERAFWPFLKPSEKTLVWNGEEIVHERDLSSADLVFGCCDSVANFVDGGGDLSDFGILLIDECHHMGSPTYDRIYHALEAGSAGGAFAMGMTATPWRPDSVDLRQYFGEPRVNIDTVAGLKGGFLANVDYRMYTDNINWSALKHIGGKSFTPRQINRTLFINEWDDAVVDTLMEAWKEQSSPRAIVFCSKIDHALVMRDKINSLGFCNAAAIFSGAGRGSRAGMSEYDRNRVLSDFDDGKINVMCAVDIFNEGIDVPDVNIIVFQRVTHSRRIFIQQLGRGLRIAEGKNKVIVLDFVSDIRRFAAGIQLKDSLAQTSEETRISLPNKVTFKKVTGDDPETETFLREWLDDVVAIEEAGEDASVLKYPPRMTPR